MRRMLPALIVLLAVTILASCKGLNSVSSQDVAGTPTVYAKVLKEPNPLLLGHWRRIPPAEFNHPWIFDYILVKKGDKYAVYYFYDSRNNKKHGYFNGWAAFTIDGDSMTSGEDGSIFYVKDGEVFMKYPDHDKPNRMQKVD